MNVHLLMNERSFIVKGKMEYKKPETLTERERKMKKLSLFLIGLMACLAIGISTARGQVFYNLEDLGVVKDMQTSEVFAINQWGHVAGTGYSGVETCAFHYNPLKKFAEDSGGLNSRGFGISSTNVVVGDAFFGPAMEPRSHAATFIGGVAKDLGVLKGQVYSRANGANGIGQIVGFSSPTRDSTESRAFMWTYQTGMRDIGTLGGPYAQANAINEAGFVTGTAQTWAMFVTTHAFIYQAFATSGPQPFAPQPPQTSGKMRDLGVLGGHSSYGMAINAYNHVAGYSTLQANSERVHAFLYIDGKGMRDLGSLGAKGTESDLSVALGVNKSDQVVGYTYLPAVGEMPLQQVAFLWRPNIGGGQMLDLNKLLGATGRNYRLISATAINDNGQIVANAFDTQTGSPRAVLLTPMGPVN
jgi:probable HAF family extracellular repeat protein